MLEVRLLGKFEVQVDGHPVELPLRAAQALLAYLLLNAGTEQPREQVAGMLWPDMTDAKAKDNLRHTLWVIRKALGNRDYLLADDFSVSFNTALDYWLDTALLERQATGAESADDLLAIVSAYGGGFLPGFYDDWVVLERERLQAVFERKMGLLLDKLVEAQRWPQVLEWGERWIALGHVPEPAYRALMAAHAGLDDMASVATTYQRCVEALKTELGVEPAAQSRTLYERLQREAKKRASDITPEVEAPRHNLPAQLTSFIGREADVAQVRDYLRSPDMRLVTLVGPPGIGKTRLSIHVATQVQRDFANGVFFVSLTPITDLNLVAPTIVQALGIVQTDQRSALECLKDGIHDRQLLVVLDNFEQIVEAAPLVSELLVACPRLKLIVTSREALRVPGEWLYPVPLLSMPEEAQLKTLTAEAFDQFSALQLFAERARAVRPDFVLTLENTPTVSAICRRLDGIPLAIELIATRLRLMSVQALLQRLNAQFVLSADGMRGASDRQKTLHQAISWSYDLLSAEEQNMFARLSVFSGDFTLETAEAILSRTVTEKSASDLITSLLDKSLLQRTFDERGELRCTMLVTVQQFALDCLRRTGEEAKVRNWHLAYFLDLAEQADREIHGPDQIAWLDRVETDHDNIHAALEWCVSVGEVERALRLLNALGWAWDVRGHYSEVRNWFEKLSALPRITDYPALYAGLLNHVGHHSWLIGDCRAARSLLEESQTMWQNLGVEGEPGLAATFAWLGIVARWCEGDDDTAQSLLERSVILRQKWGDQWGLALSLLTLSSIEVDRNHAAEALALLDQSLTLFRQLGDLWGIARVSQQLGQLFLKQGNHERARSFFDQHLAIDERLHFQQGTVIALANLGDLYRHQGDYERAEQFYEKSLVLCREYGLKNDLSINLYCLGMVELHRSNYLSAVQYFIDSFNLAWVIYENISACDLLASLAAVAAGTNQPERAAKLYGAAQALLDTTDYRIRPFDQAEFDRHLQIAREQLGETQFEALVAKGRTLTLEQAIAEALESNG